MCLLAYSCWLFTVESSLQASQGAVQSCFEGSKARRRKLEVACMNRKERGCK